ncbi:MAG: glycosyltransferase [bacterium]|nr:glycosyltransferase [bacterium]
MAKPHLSVVIPCYNEAINLQKGVLHKVAEFLQGENYFSEVIVVDDGSSDESVSLVEKFIKNHPLFSLIKNPHQGKAATVVTGMLRAEGDYILFADMDQATPIEEIDNLLPHLKDYDIVIGSRSSQRRGAPLTRLLMARGFMFLRNLILGIKISDTQCGFKLFKQEVVKNLFPKLKIYSGGLKIAGGSMVTAGFDVEVLFLAQKLGYKIQEVPVEWRYVETRRVGIFKDSWQALRDMVKIRLNSLRGVYG